MSANMKILVLGHKGMLGQAVLEAADDAGYGAVYRLDIDVTDFNQLKVADELINPDTVINCAGAIPLKKRSDAQVAMVNAVAPHLICEAFPGSHIVHVSTDCVFSGAGTAPHRVGDLPDPSDHYGRTKLAGELSNYRFKCEHYVTVRTSFIGPDHGLLPWFLKQEQSVKAVPGWVNASWSGSTHKEVARHLVRIAEERVVGIAHLAAPPISKHDLLVLLRDVFNKKIDIEPVEFPRINRALEPTQFMLPVSECVEDLK